MKIMFVIHSLSSVGGAETILTRYANFFSKEDQVSITLLSNKKIHFNLNKNINIYEFNNKIAKKSLFRKINLPYQQIKHIAKSIKTDDPDIIVSFISATNILATVAARLEKKPIILAERSSYHRAVKNDFWKFLRRITYPFANTVIVLTQEDKPKYHFVKNVFVLQNPLILKNQHTKVQREKIILGVGRLNNVKGFDMLIKAFSKVSSNDWKLIIAGEGKERTTLENLITEYNLINKVELVGLIEDMEYYYKRSSIFILSSRSEGFPGALCEAMGYGCASIAFDCPTGPKEIIKNGENGILIEPNNIQLLTKEIEVLINNETTRKRIGTNALNISKNLEINNISQEWKKIMHKTILEYKEKYV